MQTTPNHTGPFPTELLINIFIYLNGPSLSVCSQVCRNWNLVISQFDHAIWPFSCKRDFESFHSFWSCKFPEPLPHRTWQDMYRITQNWYTGQVTGYYPVVVATNETKKKNACAVIGIPQEQGMFTSLTLCQEGHVVRSNPSTGLTVQSPNTKEGFFLDVAQAVVCHYTQPNSNWVVTGGLNGTVAIWDLMTKSLVRMWPGHRGRVLCISMNDQAVVSGGSDGKIHVWDLDKDRHPTCCRGMIPPSSYLSSQNDWFQGVGEIAVNGHLVACAPDASGPILVFSLLTGTVVYELHGTDSFTRLLLTPFFLLTKSKVLYGSKEKLVPSKNNVVIQRTQNKGYMTKFDDITTTESAAPMTPYQLYQSMNQQEAIPTSSACINVWNLKTGKIQYSLVPTLENPYQNYTITDIRSTPDYSKVFASIEIRGQKEYQERLYCWDFAATEQEQFDVVELDNLDPVLRKNGKSWVCYM